LLFSEDRDARKEGLQQCEMWSHRGKVPSAVDATVVVLAAQLQDVAGAESGMQQDPLQLRMAYSMALTRFVNGVVDMQQKGKFAASISTLAASVELPRIFVDLRQDATHGALPALSVLRFAAQRALTWIQERYWQKQADVLHTGEATVTAGLSNYATLISQQVTMPRTNESTIHPAGLTLPGNDTVFAAGGRPRSPAKQTRRVPEKADFCVFYRWDKDCAGTSLTP
jgi:hypothetical protein